VPSQRALDGFRYAVVLSLPAGDLLAPPD